MQESCNMAARGKNRKENMVAENILPQRTAHYTGTIFWFPLPGS
jgi:hypothetical protein